MRALVLALLAMVAASPLVDAQAPTFDEAHQVRVGRGDIPTTDPHEGAGWNVVQSLRVEHAGGAGNITLQLPGGVLSGTSCTCSNYTTSFEGDLARFLLPATTPAGPVTVTATSNLGAGRAIAIDLTVQGPPGVVIVYAPLDDAVEAPAEPSTPGRSTDGSANILVFQPVAGAFWLAVHPAASAPQQGVPSAFPWLVAGAAFVLGCIVWALLVSRGMVQRKARKQLAAVAPHVAAAQAEAAPMLEGRKRALMAGLKELELARQAGEMDVATYDALKAELKGETVTVLRALDDAGKRPG